MVYGDEVGGEPKFGGNGIWFGIMYFLVWRTGNGYKREVY